MCNVAKKFVFIILVSFFAAFIVIFIYSMTYKNFMKKLYPIYYKNYVDIASEKYGVDESLIYAVIKAESKFDVYAESRVGAKGLMQIMPETFRWLQSQREGVYMDETYLYDPFTNIDYGTFFLSILQNKYKSDRLVICAYNAGMGAVDRWLLDKNFSIDNKTLYHIPYNETRIYQSEVIINQKMYRKLYFEKEENCI